MQAMSKETVNAYRVTFLVDADTFQFLARAHAHDESGELWLWESTEETTTEREFCNECERALGAGEGQAGYCQWCYETQGL